MPTTPFDTYVPSQLMPFMDPEEAHTMVVAFVPAGAGLTVSLAKGLVLGQVTATGKMTTYATAAVDGSGVARGILQYAITVDDAGRVTISGDRTFQERGAPMYYTGIFKSEDLTGLDADAVADLQGRLIVGDLTSGVFKF